MNTILGANGTIASILAKELTQYATRIRLVSQNLSKVPSMNRPQTMTMLFRNAQQVGRSLTTEI